MKRKRASVRQLVLHVEQCASALRAEIRTQDDRSDQFYELDYLMRFLVSGIVHLRKRSSTKGR
jgi:hypothetical protein